MWRFISPPPLLFINFPLRLIEFLLKHANNDTMFLLLHMLIKNLIMQTRTSLVRFLSCSLKEFSFFVISPQTSKCENSFEFSPTHVRRTKTNPKDCMKISMCDVLQTFLCFVQWITKDGFGQSGHEATIFSVSLDEFPSKKGNFPFSLCSEKFFKMTKLPHKPHKNWGFV